MVVLKRLLCILLACALTVQPVYVHLVGTAFRLVHDVRIPNLVEKRIHQ